MRLEVIWGNHKDVHEVLPRASLFRVLKENYEFLEEFPWDTGEFRTDWNLPLLFPYLFLPLLPFSPELFLPAKQTPAAQAASGTQNL